MWSSIHKYRRWLAALSLVIGIGVVAARGAIVDLDAYVLNPILGGDGVTPLADGSWVMIIGSTDGIIDPMQLYGASNYIANSVTGDDVILGIVQIDSALGSGTFATTVQYDSSVINYVYIRFFDTNGPLTGMIWWGVSPIIGNNPGGIGITLGVSTVQFDQGGQLVATNYNNFVIIPEPSTANLLLLVGGMIWAMRSSMARKKEEKDIQKENDA